MFELTPRRGRWALLSPGDLAATTLVILAGLMFLALQGSDVSRRPDDDSLVIRTTAGDLTPLDVERRITFPFVRAVKKEPGVRQIRSRSERGLSSITIVCDSSSAAERLKRRLDVALPALAPTLAGRAVSPIVSGGRPFEMPLARRNSPRR